MLNAARKGFTLAEVLITLTILGVLAALVIPSLYNAYQESVWKTGYKKAFSIASQALQLCANDNALVPRSAYDDGASNKINFNCLKSHFSVVKDCSSNNNSQCWATGELFRGGTPSSGEPAFIDNSGMTWSMRYSDVVGCGTITSIILVDINGSKSPNQYGRDRFPFIMANNVAGKPTNLMVIENYSTGIPAKLISFYDALDNSESFCPSNNCYYTSWLKQ